MLALGGRSAPAGLAWLYPGRTATPTALGDVGAALEGARAVSVEHALDARVRLPAMVSRVPSITVVGPDGAPLWRASDYTVERLRTLGFEPGGVRRFLASDSGERTEAGPIRFLDMEALERENRRELLAMESDARNARLHETLEGCGISIGAERLAIVWEALRPRLRRMREVDELLAFLKASWRPPQVAEELRAQLEALPPRFEGLDALIDHLAGTAGARAKQRRLVRWALTGQTVAPRLEHVWELLGTREAMRRLSAGAGAGLSPGEDL